MNEKQTDSRRYREIDRETDGGETEQMRERQKQKQTDIRSDGWETIRHSRRETDRMRCR